MVIESAQVLLIAVLSFAQPAGAEATGECCCRGGESRVWIAVEKDIMTVSRGRVLPPAVRDKLGQDAVIVGCREFKSEAAAGSESAGIKLHCVDAEFLTGREMEGRAAHLVYDSSSGTLELRGDDDQGVQLWSKSPAGESMQVAAREMRIDLQHRRLALKSSCALEFATAGCACPAAGCCAQVEHAASKADEPVIRPACEGSVPRLLNFDFFEFAR